MSYKTSREIKRANQLAGRHFFDKETMEHWSSRVYPEVYGGRYFITSECHDLYAEDPWAEHNRDYTVRECREDGSIWEASASSTRVSSLAAAREHAIRLAEEQKKSE